MSPTRARASSRSRKSAAKPATPPRPFVAHRLVPPHELLSEEESKRVLAELRMVPERLPKILLQDPGLNTDPKFVKAKEAGVPLGGRLVRIRRPSDTAGLSIAYRVIVAGTGGA